MSTVKVSSKYQVAIPREMRESLKLKPGQELAIFNINGSIRLVPIRPIKEMRGFLKGMNTDNLRDKKDRTL